MTDDLLIIAKNYADEVKKSGINLKGMYLFGSRIKGNNHKWSDLDIGLITNDFAEDRIAGLSKLFYLGTKVSEIIEPHLFTEVEFQDKYDSLATEIKRTGVKVF